MASNVSITWRPLTHWPAGRARTSEYSREDAKFARGEWKQNRAGDPNSGSSWTKTRTPLSTTLSELDRELWMIGARDVVVQLDVRNDAQFRRDGTGPLTDARVNSPAVVLSFVRNKTPYVFAGDYFKRWEDNLRAIALGLEGLRRLERYHIAQAGDQYRGWQQLPSSTTTALSTEGAADVLQRRTGRAAAAIVTDRAVARAAYREAANSAHPDAGGSTADFQLIQEAKRVLEAHFGGTL